MTTKSQGFDVSAGLEPINPRGGAPEGGHPDRKGCAAPERGLGWTPSGAPLPRLSVREIANLGGAFASRD
jgi:hypothetical protein